MLKRIESVTTSDFPKNIPIFRIIHNKENAFSTIAQIIENSTGIVYIITTLEDVSKMYYSNIPEKIMVCEKNGGEVRLLVNEKNTNLTSFITRFGATKTKINNVNISGRIIVEKDKQLIMSTTKIAKSQKNGDFSIYTNSQEIVNNIENLCEYLWTDSKMIKSIDINNFKKKESTVKPTIEPNKDNLFELNEIKQENILLYAILENTKTIIAKSRLEKERKF